MVMMFSFVSVQSRKIMDGGAKSQLFRSQKSLLFPRPHSSRVDHYSTPSRGCIWLQSLTFYSFIHGLQREIRGLVYPFCTLEKVFFLAARQSFVLKNTPSLVSHAVGFFLKRKVAEIEALYTLLKVRYSGPPGASGVLEIKVFLLPKKRPRALSIIFRDLTLTKENIITILRRMILSRDPDIQKSKRSSQ